MGVEVKNRAKDRAKTSARGAWTGGPRSGREGVEGQPLLSLACLSSLLIGRGEKEATSLKKRPHPTSGQLQQSQKKPTNLFAKWYS
jgi:hypothetical protein